MVGLSDMEELLSRISSKPIVDYMREAMVCYHGHAYRGCIVMSYIALFDDLRHKLSELAKTNSIAKTISKEIEKRADEQQIFESYMADQLKAAKLLSEVEASKLELIRTCRNKAAHPSGVHASPEEARFVFFEVIDKFLSKEQLRTTDAVDALLARLSSANFFPTTAIKEVEAIVSTEIGGIHDSAIPYLIAKLVDSRSASDATIVKNVEFFLTGLAATKRPDIAIQIRARVVKAKAEDSSFGQCIVRMISANATVLEGLDDHTVLRLRTLLDSAVDEIKPTIPVTKLTHPVYMLSSMLEGLGEDAVLKDFNSLTEKILGRYTYITTLLQKVSKKPKVAAKLVPILKSEASSSTFQIANEFASSVPDIDSLFPEFLSPEDAFKIMVGVYEAARTGAFTSRDLRNSRFASTPNLKSLAARYAENHPEAAGEVIEGANADLSLSRFVEEYLQQEDAGQQENKEQQEDAGPG